MSTSPSWFDQEKFSRLVKKVGPKSAPGQVGASQPLPKTGSSEPLPETKVSPSVPDTDEDSSESLIGADTPQSLLETESSPPKPDPTLEAFTPAPAATAEPLPKPLEADSSLSEVPPKKDKRLGMMTSQSVSLAKVRVTGPGPGPIRASSETANISLASKAPSTEQRALPSLPRRTSPLPALKDIFQYEIPASQPSSSFPPQPPPPDHPAPSSARSFPPPLPFVKSPLEDPADAPVPLGEEKRESPVLSSPGSVPARGTSHSTALAQSADDLAAAWEKITQLTDDLTRASQERDQAINEGVLLREQLKQADEQLAGHDGATPTEDLVRVTRERDDALSEASQLRDQAHQGSDSASQLDELSHVTRERDDMRRDYMELREQFENLKQERLGGKSETEEDRGKQEQELENLRQQLADHEREAGEGKEDRGKLQQDLDDLRRKLADHEREAGEGKEDRSKLQQELDDLRQKLADREREGDKAKDGASSTEDVDKLKQEVNTLREQVTEAKGETSSAQRGMALSQKALHETRDAMREAGETAAQVKASLENLRKENSTLVQQNMLLQAQHDQVSRDLSSVKAKLAAKS